MTLPETLYHYTDAAALIGIVTGRAVWASQLQFMNDREEFAHARHEGARLVNERIDSRPPQSQDLIRKIAQKLETGRTIIRNFVFSLSERPDILSQWRGYAPNGGYCIGFSTAYLRELCHKHSFSLAQCVYDQSTKEAAVDRILDEVIRPIHSSKMTEQEEQNFIGNAIQAFRSVAPIFKHRSFEEEAEWRIWGMVDRGSHRSKWRARGSLVHPYAELALHDPGEGQQILNEVWIGPGLDKDLARHPLEFMLTEAGMQCPVRFSESTLR